MLEKEIITQFQSDNEIHYIEIYGGILGAFLGSDKHLLNKRFKKLNAEGWRILSIHPQAQVDLFKKIMRAVMLVVTLFMFTWSDGYYVLSEKSKRKKEQEKLDDSLFN